MAAGMLCLQRLPMIWFGFVRIRIQSLPSGYHATQHEPEDAPAGPEDLDAAFPDECARGKQLFPNPITVHAA